jgi:hypothetical protein
MLIIIILIFKILFLIVLYPYYTIILLSALRAIILCENTNRCREVPELIDNNKDQELILMRELHETDFLNQNIDEFALQIIRIYTGVLFVGVILCIILYKYTK